MAETGAEEGQKTWQYWLIKMEVNNLGYIMVNEMTAHLAVSYFCQGSDGERHCHGMISHNRTRSSGTNGDLLWGFSGLLRAGRQINFFFSLSLPLSLWSCHSSNDSKFFWSGFGVPPVLMLADRLQVVRVFTALGRRHLCIFTHSFHWGAILSFSVNSLQMAAIQFIMETASFCYPARGNTFMSYDRLLLTHLQLFS